MDDSTSNLIFFLIFAFGIVLIILKILFFSSNEEIKKMADDARERKSNEIKKGIQYSKIHGTKKSRKINL